MGEVHPVPPQLELMLQKTQSLHAGFPVAVYSGSLKKLFLPPGFPSKSPFTPQFTEQVSGHLFRL